MANQSTNKAYTIIRNKILTGEYLPGTNLSANALTSEIGVSRTPIQSALRQLEIDGLVVNRPKVGAQVKSMSVRDFRELCWLRKVLESNAGALAAMERTPADLLVISEAHEEMSQLVKNKEAFFANENISREMARKDVHFHLAIIEATHNNLLKREIVRLRVVNRVISGFTPIPVDKNQEYAEAVKTVLEHLQVLQAIEKQDAKAALACMELHIEDIIVNTVRRMELANDTEVLEFGL